MLYNLKLKIVEKPWLGQQRTTDKIRKFRRDKKGRIAIDTVQWQWALASAARALDYSVNVETIRTESGFEPPKLTLYNRKYHYKGKPHEEMFEAIREGTQLNIPILVMESNDVEGQQYTAPSKEELLHIFEYVGMFIGLSPWGSRWGFGLYDTLDVSRVKPNQNEEQEQAGNASVSPEAASTKEKAKKEGT